MLLDIQAEKLRLIQWLAGLNDPGTIREIIDIKKPKEVDWWNTISEEERTEIEEGLGPEWYK